MGAPALTVRPLRLYITSDPEAGTELHITGKRRSSKPLQLKLQRLPLLRGVGSNSQNTGYGPSNGLETKEPAWEVIRL